MAASRFHEDANAPPAAFSTSGESCEGPEKYRNRTIAFGFTVFYFPPVGEYLPCSRRRGRLGIGLYAARGEERK
jgi:hypothetical protein